jgi:aldehyde dehydrogenase (NAD+)
MPAPVGGGAAGVRNRKKVQIEMGSKNPQEVLDDADLKQAMELSTHSCFYSTGQRGTASSRLIVTDRIYLAFVEALKACSKYVCVRVRSSSRLLAGTEKLPAAIAANKSMS